VISGFVGTTVPAIEVYGASTTVAANLTSGAYQFALQCQNVGCSSIGNLFANGQYGASATVNVVGTTYGNNGFTAGITAPTVAQQVTTAATAAGTNLATAFPLVSPYTYFNTVASGTGAALPPNAAARGQEWVVWNFGSNTLTIYAQTGDTIVYGASTTIAAGAKSRFVSSGNGLWLISGT
jgi:hypothetical protein